MAITLSEYYGIDNKKFDELNVLNAFIDIDSRFFVDPHLLRNTSIPEFKSSRQKLDKYFEHIITLLRASQQKGDIAWREAKKRLVFRELRGVSIGHGRHSSDGSGVGSKLAEKLLYRASELIRLGVNEPEIFELIGLFVEDFGPDRLSDMTIRIIRNDICLYTERMVQELGITALYKLKTPERTYTLPLHPKGHKYLFLLPRKLLRDLPVAKSWNDISDIVFFNSQLRKRYNDLVARVWKRKSLQFRKKYIKSLLTNSTDISTFINSYRQYKTRGYDFVKDPNGEIEWYKTGQEIANKIPLQLSLPSHPNIADVENIVIQIIQQFKKNIEFNSLNIFLYVKEAHRKKRRRERFSQLLFYAISDSYCRTNNLDLNAEPNAGSGPVDFKYSRGYVLKFIVEIKLSSNSNLVNGYTKQVITYEQSEGTEHSAYVIIQVSRYDEIIKKVLKIEDELKTKGKPYPKVYVIDGRLKPSASKRK